MLTASRDGRAVLPTARTVRLSQSWSSRRMCTNHVLRKPVMIQGEREPCNNMLADCRARPSAAKTEFNYSDSDGCTNTVEVTAQA